MNKNTWTSKFAFILAASGSAIGLGNIWKFPYVAGQNGGAYFIFIYLICVLLLGLPLMFAEFLIGKSTKSNAVNAFKILEGKANFWIITGFIGVLASFIILSFYSVISAWILHYIFQSIYGGFQDINTSNMLSNLLNNPIYMIFLHFVFMSLTVFIVLLGVNKGIERAATIMMPSLFIILIILFIYSIFLDGAFNSFLFLFKPDFSKVKTSTFIEALGQAFFSLSIGMGAMITYAAYLKKETSLLKSSLLVIILDTLIALIAGFVVFSIVFSFNIDISSGPTLVFTTLPNLFSKIIFGRFISILFFILLAFAALSSAISILEVTVAFCIETFFWTRKKASILIGSIAFLIGILSALSFNKLKDFKLPTHYIFNSNLNFFETMDKLASNILLPLGGILISIYFGWKLDRKIIYKETSNLEHKFVKIFIFLLKYFIPIVTILILFYAIELIHPALKFLKLL